jgi:pilus assembly protein FimV
LNHRSTNAARFALKGVALAMACLWGSQAAALGLGRLNVQSTLGEALKAEIEVTSITGEEAATLRLRVAPPDAYRSAGVEYNAVLPTAQVQVVKRADGRSFLRVTSDRAVLEPFVDVIVEATWSSGRLVREYTLLFDPPNLRTAQAPVPQAPPVISPAPAVAAAAPAPMVAATSPVATPGPQAPSVPMSRPAAPPRAKALGVAPVQAPAASPPATPPAAGSNTHLVRPGETLSRIAARTQASGISLDQMLISLYRGNPRAFINDNINLLKAGSVLAVPSAEQAATLSPQAAAREVILAQSSDFGAYRQRLAAGATAAPEAAPARQAKGQVQAQVDDRKAAAAATPDKLTLTQGGTKSAAPVPSAPVVDKKDDKTRLAELNRNVEDLKKLQGATVPATPAPAPVVAAAPAPASAAAAVVVPIAAASAAAAAAPPLAASVASAPAKPTAPKPTPPKPTVAPADEEPGFLSTLFDNDLLLPGAGLLVALLAGLGLYKLRGRVRKTAGETSFLESRLQPDSFFGASGGQRIDTREAGSTGNAVNSSSMSYSMSQLDAIGDVDPVAEADVYLAYGRDLQAEEILKEAMRAAPERMAIRTKLLEVYAKRRDTKAFELLATQLYSLTGGTGEDWSKAQAMGQAIDSDNALYVPGGGPQGQRSGDGKPRPDALGAATQPYMAPPVASTFEAAADAKLGGRLDLDLEFDLPGAAPAARRPAPAPDATPPAAAPNVMRLEDGLDLTLDAPTAPRAVAVPPQPAPPTPVAPPAREEGELLDFDLSGFGPDEPTAVLKPEASDNSLDFGDFDLGAPASEPPSAESAGLTRKLELAEEFRQIGDTEGARDLLEEVVAKAGGSLKTKAQGMLDQLARG